MLEEGKIFIGASRNPDDSINKPEYLDLKFGNRHGLIAGATKPSRTVWPATGWRLTIGHSTG